MVSESINEALNNRSSLMAVYDKKSESFTYHNDLTEYLGIEPADAVLWSFLEKKKITTAKDAASIKEIALSLDERNSVFFTVISFGVRGRHILSFTYIDGKVIILLKLFDQGDLDPEKVKYDELTRLMSRNSFCRETARLNAQNIDTEYALFYFDIVKFKLINELFGYEEGDAILKHIATALKRSELPIISASRINADHFAFLADIGEMSANEIMTAVIEKIQSYDKPVEITVNAGIYIVPKTEKSGDMMLDRARLAQSVIRGSYTNHINFYNDKLHDELLSEQEIYADMNTALTERQFVAYYQPQYNHSTGMLVGAEALVRWIHPTKGIISPGRFIPIFEKNGFITKLDLYIFEEAARFLKDSIDKGLFIVPISVNFSKHDIFSQNFVESLEDIRKKHNVPAKHLRIEITESVLVGESKAINDILNKLHAHGYIIEMDDFGSGYSSLNVLKNLDFDIVKLDMLFLDKNDDNNRGGTILASIINMAKWLNLPVIAEGVETIEQADFLKSIGCNYIQGYLYSKPLSESDYRDIISRSTVGAMVPQLKLNEKFDSANFWSPTSQETLIFSNFVGAAAIFNYNRKTKAVEMLRVNSKYLTELGMNLTEHDIIHKNPTDLMDEKSRNRYYAVLERAVESGDEQECETWRNIESDCCGAETFCIRSNVTVIAKSNEWILFYAMIRNITAEKRSLEAMIETEKRFKMASEQVNIYFWEYTIATREMRPCFRCMRDLGLPPLLRNYPDSAIERGIFPPEVADMYRDWHIQVANGVKELEAVIPLTPDRIPFRVRYTTEFDENGHPVKAYGSAALIVD